MPATAVKRDAPPGWYGKLPSRGDFVGRRLPPGFVRRWDDWLQHGLADARERFGAAWLDRYLVAPVWRFWLGPGVMRAGVWGGVLMPSVDGVGRHFPLTVAAPAAALAPTLAARAWFGELEAAARQVLDVAFEVADLEAALAGVAAAAGDDLSCAALADMLLSRHSGACSVWWCGDAGPATAFHCFDGLPPPASCALLLAPPQAEEATVTDLLP